VTKHPELEIARLADDDLDAARRAQVIAHLLSCQRCRDLRAGLERSAQALRRTSAPLTPSFDAVRGRRRGGIPLLAMLAAAIVLTSIVAVDRARVSSSVAATPSATSTATLGAACSESSANGSLIRVCPGTAAIGDAVIISGRNCNLPGRQTPVALAFSGDSPGAGTAGGVELPPIPIDRDGNFTTTFRIPAALLATQGYGGGPVMPGEYRFISYPPQCVVTFRVVAK
jgi:hypothetical protein